MSLTESNSETLISIAKWVRAGVVILFVNTVMTGGAMARLQYQLAPPAWEYRIEFLSDAQTTTGLQRLGNERWELVDIRRARGDAEVWGAEITLRRPKR